MNRIAFLALPFSMFLVACNDVVLWSATEELNCEPEAPARMKELNEKLLHGLSKIEYEELMSLQCSHMIETEKSCGFENKPEIKAEYCGRAYN